MNLDKSDRSSTRITVTLPHDDYDQVLLKAKALRVSAAWVVRDAVEKYLAGDVPLLVQLNSQGGSNQ
jgi:hypothetical protein